ncbi:MAG: hypothetical protein K2X86_15105 [Cytophagaceae bacterium]|nr:hypothetical protein [Cytophagaceae bacterium]
MSWDSEVLRRPATAYARTLPAIEVGQPAIHDHHPDDIEKFEKNSYF